MFIYTFNIIIVEPLILVKCILGDSRLLTLQSAVVRATDFLFFFVQWSARHSPRLIHTGIYTHLYVFLLIFYTNSDFWNFEVDTPVGYLLNGDYGFKIHWFFDAIWGVSCGDLPTSSLFFLQTYQMFEKENLVYEYIMIFCC